MLAPTSTNVSFSFITRWGLTFCSRDTKNMKKSCVPFLGMALTPCMAYGLSGKKSITDILVFFRYSSLFFLPILIRNNNLKKMYRYLAYFKKIDREFIQFII